MGAFTLKSARVLLAVTMVAGGLGACSPLTFNRLVGAPGGGSSEDEDDGVTPPVPFVLEVAPLYTHGQNWNDWAKSDDSAACAGTETEITDCVHGGEKRVALTEYSTCAGLSAADTLGVFDWTCEVHSGTARFVSSFKSNKGLEALISPAGAWLANSVTVSGGAGGPLVSDPEVWWSNTILPLPASNSATPTSLAGEGTIYYLANNGSGGGYVIADDKVSIVVSLTASYTNNVRSTVDLISAAPSTDPSAVSAIVVADGKKFLWVTGAFTASGSKEIGLFFKDVQFSYVRQTALSALQGSVGTAAQRGTLDGAICAVEPPVPAGVGNAARGIFLSGSSKNYFYNVAITNIKGGVGGAGIIAAFENCAADFTDYQLFGAVAGNGGDATGLYLTASNKNNFAKITIQSISSDAGGDEIASPYYDSSANCYSYMAPKGASGKAYGIYLSSSSQNSFDQSTVNNVAAWQPLGQGLAATFSGNEAIGLYLINSSGNRFVATKVSAIAGSNGGSPINAMVDPCSSAPINLGPTSGRDAFGIQVVGSSVDSEFVETTISQILGGSSVAQSPGNIVSGGGDISPAVGGVAYGIFRSSIVAGSSLVIDDIQISDLISGNSASGFSDQVNGFSISGSAVYGIRTTGNGQLAISNGTFSDFAAGTASYGDFGGATGGGVYGVSFGGTNLTATAIAMDDFRASAGSEGDPGGDGGSVYGIYDLNVGGINSVTGITLTNAVPGLAHPGYSIPGVDGASYLTDLR